MQPTENRPRPTPWWRSAVVYQIYPRSFADSTGNGIGDLPAVTARLDHLAQLGVDALWLSPVYPSPMADGGYDVADYRDIEPLFGTLSDAQELIRRAHERGLRVLFDLVPNHTSDEHAWFVEALAAPAGSAARARYIFRDGRGEDGALPPNGWQSLFGGPAWSRVTGPDGRPGQWYLHLFHAKQPDLNWDNGDVVEEFHSILRFWLDRGVDGFRIDVAHGLVKDPALPEWDGPLRMLDAGLGSPAARPPMWDQEGVHEIYRGWRRVLDGYDGDRVLVAEAWVEPPDRLARYLRPDELHQAFAFAFLEASWHATELRTSIERALGATAGVGAAVTWVLSNHDVIRHPTRLALPRELRGKNGIGPGDPQPDQVLGRRRGRAATALMLALPGAAYLYQGEELGLPEATTLPDDVRQDPTFLRSHGAELGRDGCRVPLPWEAGSPALGFSPTGRSWLPQPASYAALAADVQDGAPGSTLEFYRTALRLRRELRLGRGELTWSAADAELLRFEVTTVDARIAVLANTGASSASLDVGADVVLASGELDADGTVPPDTTVWIRVS